MQCKLGSVGHEPSLSRHAGECCCFHAISNAQPDDAAGPGLLILSPTPQRSPLHPSQCCAPFQHPYLLPQPQPGHPAVIRLHLHHRCRPAAAPHSAACQLALVKTVPATCRGQRSTWHGHLTAHTPGACCSCTAKKEGHQNQEAYCQCSC